MTDACSSMARAIAQRTSADSPITKAIVLITDVGSLITGDIVPTIDNTGLITEAIVMAVSAKSPMAIGTITAIDASSSATGDTTSMAVVEATIPIVQLSPTPTSPVAELPILVVCLNFFYHTKHVKIFYM